MSDQQNNNPKNQDFQVYADNIELKLNIELVKTNARIDVLESHLNARFDRLDAKIDGLVDSVQTKFESVDRQFESIDKQFESIDKQIGFVYKQIDDVKRDRQWIYASIIVPIIIALAPAVTNFVQQNLQSKSVIKAQVLKD
jgi:chromosome segregation ATPase